MTNKCVKEPATFINPLTPNEIWRRRAVRPLKIKIPSKNMRENPNKYKYSFSLLCIVAPTRH
jgi:hypothetical protein